MVFAVKYKLHLKYLVVDPQRYYLNQFLFICFLLKFL